MRQNDHEIHRGYVDIENMSSSEWGYKYCLYIEDVLEARNYITDSEYAKLYCLNIKNRPEIRKFVKE